MGLTKKLQILFYGVLVWGYGNTHTSVSARTFLPAQVSVSQRTQQLAREGQQAFQQKQWERAISLFTASLALNDKQPYLLNARGVAYLNLGLAEQAIADFNACRELLPRQALPYFNLGNAYRLQDRRNDAVTAYTEAIALNPKYIAAYNNRGITYSELKNYAAALKDYQQSLRLNPRDLDVRNNRGYLYLLQKDYTRALQDFNAVLRKDSRHALAYGNKAQALYLQGQCEAAIPLLDKSCALGNTKACRVVKSLQCKVPSPKDVPLDSSGAQVID